MIVRQFISWVRTAPAGERAEATRSLARAWILSDLSEDDRAAAEGALLMLLDDPSPLLIDADLVDLVATGNSDIQCAIARRIQLPASVCAAIAEVGSPASALEL